MWKISDVLEGCGGGLQGTLPHTAQFDGFSIDTRTIRRNNLFFALSGPHFNGHHFVANAIQKGAKGAVVSRDAFKKYQQQWQSQTRRLFFILVDDPLHALQALAKWHRRRHDLPLVGITGSNGKTTTKEMLASILSTQGSVLKTQGNLNNHIGLPLSLLRLNTAHKAAVLEMGINKKGEMAQLCDISKPTVGLITNIGPAHLKGLGNLAGVAEEKCRLFQSVSEGGTAIINRDDPYLKPWENRLPDRWTFGIHQNQEESAAAQNQEESEAVQNQEESEAVQNQQVADITATEIILKSDQTHFKLRQNRSKESVNISLPVPGRHQVENALAAATAAAALGIDLRAISEGLSRFQTPSHRTEIFKTKGITVLFDAYNANPASVKAAIDLLISCSGGAGQRIALLGEMLELGDISASAHFKIGKMVADGGINRLIAVGLSAGQTAQGARAGGLPSDAISIHYDFASQDLSSIEMTLKKVLKPGDTLLIKGSRGMELERLLPLIGISESESTANMRGENG